VDLREIRINRNEKRPAEIWQDVFLFAYFYRNPMLPSHAPLSRPGNLLDVDALDYRVTGLEGSLGDSPACKESNIRRLDSKLTEQLRKTDVFLDVVFQLSDEFLLAADDGLDQVAHRNHPDRFFTIYYQQVPDVLGGH